MPQSDPISVVAAQAAHGSVQILADGSLRYTPKPGYIGKDRITYWIEDGDGGRAKAFVTIDVAANDYVYQSEVFGFEGPEWPSYPEAIAPRDTLVADGAVIEAVFDIESLRSIAGSLGADGVVLASVNSARSLNGICTLGNRGSALEVIAAERARELAARAGLADVRLFRMSEPLLGFSMRHNVPGNLGGLSDREQIVIDSSVCDGTLIIQISNTIEAGTRRIVDYRVTRSDGTEIPDWLQRADNGLFIGRRAADAETLKLKIEAVYSDGTVVIERVEIDAITGEIRLQNWKEGLNTPRLFKDQINAPSMLTFAQIESLGKALTP